jgi:hypothetical protein
MDIQETDISFSALDSADVRAVEITGERKGLLGESFLLPQHANSLAEIPLSSRFLVCAHWRG